MIHKTAKIDPPCTIKVFREHPWWDLGKRWWQMPADIYREIFLAEWEVGHDDTPSRADMDHVRRPYPGAVVLVCLSP